MGHATGGLDHLLHRRLMLVHVDRVLVPIELYCALITVEAGATAGRLEAGEEVLGVTGLSAILVLDDNVA